MPRSSAVPKKSGSFSRFLTALSEPWCRKRRIGPQSHRTVRFDPGYWNPSLQVTGSVKSLREP